MQKKIVERRMAAMKLNGAELLDGAEIDKKCIKICRFIQPLY